MNIVLCLSGSNPLPWFRVLSELGTRLIELELYRKVVTTTMHNYFSSIGSSFERLELSKFEPELSIALKSRIKFPANDKYVPIDEA